MSVSAEEFKVASWHCRLRGYWAQGCCWAVVAAFVLPVTRVLRQYQFLNNAFIVTARLLNAQILRDVLHVMTRCHRGGVIHGDPRLITNAVIQSPECRVDQFRLT